MVARRGQSDEAFKEQVRRARRALQNALSCYSGRRVARSRYPQNPHLGDVELALSTVTAVERAASRGTYSEDETEAILSHLEAARSSLKQCADLLGAETRTARRRKGLIAGVQRGLSLLSRISYGIRDEISVAEMVEQVVEGRLKKDEKKTQKEEERTRKGSGGREGGKVRRRRIEKVSISRQ